MRMTMSSPSVDGLGGVHSAWQQELQAAYAALSSAHHHCQQLDASHTSVESFQASLFAVERRVLMTQLQLVCRDKMALKKQIHRLKREAAATAGSRRPQQQQQQDAAPPPAAATAAPSANLYEDSATATPTTTSSAATPTSASASHHAQPAASKGLSAAAMPPTAEGGLRSIAEQSEGTTRLENEELRAQVRRLRDGHQSLLSVLRQKEADIAACELTIQRLKQERQRALDRLRDAEEREQRQMEQLSVMHDVMKRAMDKERLWMEARANMETELAQLRDVLRRSGTSGGGGGAGGVTDGSEDGSVLGGHHRAAGSRDSNSGVDVLRLRSASIDSDSDSAGGFDSAEDDDLA